jgi:hypothetical protein
MLKVGRSPLFSSRTPMRRIPSLRPHHGSRGVGGREIPPILLRAVIRTAVNTLPPHGIPKSGLASTCKHLAVSSRTVPGYALVDQVTILAQGML